jgi:hypothetical protein
MLLEGPSRLIRMEVSNKIYSDSRNSLPVYVFGVDHCSATSMLPQGIRCTTNLYKKLYICTFIIIKSNLLN